jgi:hypothetical protein
MLHNTLWGIPIAQLCTVPNLYYICQWVLELRDQTRLSNNTFKMCFVIGFASLFLHQHYYLSPIALVTRAGWNYWLETP